jgi:hypothetical protein
MHEESTLRISTYRRTSGRNLGWSPPAHADAVPIARQCDNDANHVRRCVWVNYDADRGVFRARAEIEDESSGLPTWSVSAHVLEFCSARGCTKYGDYDGRHEVSDDIHSSLGRCETGGRRLVWVRADFSWTNGRLPYSQTLTANGSVC